ncbi:gametocyte-specific factor 1-like [Lethenteron reissneri]|uniref:gametocyte-specific factor 1-like n=1 Tax=Lethenteron reissneri TaxID=7753 RepID=UPI002AB7EA8D|nr:gametocyte-specific factor 1-like [Lethenteron reissneri]
MALDKDEVLSCPFNKNHKVHVCRFPYHIVKCRKNYPMLAREMATCPFNACHIMPRCELQRHISRCPQRSYVERELSHAMKLSNGGVPKVLPTPPCHSAQMECTEDWDVGGMSPAMKTLFKKQLGDAMDSDCSMVNIRIPSTLPDVLSEWMEDCAVGGHPSTGQRKKL